MQPRRTTSRTAFASLTDLPDLPSDFARRVIDWQRTHGRHDLPWQNTRDAYRVWLSEIMLQQTQVSAVLGYYARFLERFPTVAALAAAPSDDVMAAWSGLGYYTRARNLHRCAQIVVSEYGGRFPAEPALLAELPGIGRSTAAAIAAFSAGARAPILDGNVKRVFARAFGIDGFPGDKKVEDRMWRIAERLLPPAEIESGIERYTQGLMDLGATVCTRGRPGCLADRTACPLAEVCVARRDGLTDSLPVPKPRKAIPERATTVLMLLHDGKVLLERRPDRGIWGGLWSLPEVGGEAGDKDAALDAHPVARAQLVAAARAHGAPGEPVEVGGLTHTFTHFRLQIHAFRIDMHTIKPGKGAWQWHGLGTLDDVGLPAPIRKLLALLTQPALL
jgi:A/G-specific adenine glycosylase